MNRLILSLSVLLTLLVSPTVTQRTIVDLSYPMDKNMLNWSNFRNLVLNITKSNLTDPASGAVFPGQIDDISYPTHLGTHLDAPIHTGHSPPGTWSLEEIPLENLVERPLSVIDIIDQSQAHPTRDYTATVDDLLKFEAKYGQIPDRSVIILRTDWCRYYGNRLQYYGNERGDFQLPMHFPGISVEAARWLVKNRNIVGLGADGPSIDCGQCHFRSHAVLNPANIYLLENINANISLVPNSGATVTLLPVKFVGASGTPVRVIAQFYEKNWATSLQVMLLPTVLLVLVTLIFTLFKN